MALIASGSRKISELTSVSGISGSTAMPIVMGGTTHRVSHEDFLTTNGLIAVLNQQNVFTEPQIVLANIANTTFGGNFIDMFVDSGSFDTFKMEVTNGKGLKMQDWDGENSQSFLEVGTNSGPITIFRNTTIDGDLKVDGNLTATQYIVSSSVSHITSSFSSGSTIFGDTLDDTHQFTGSVLITGSILTNGNIGSTGNINAVNVNALNVNAQSFTGSLSFTNLTNRPTLVSGSSQVSFNGIIDKPTLVSGSSQVSFNGIIDKPTLVSGSSQVSFNGIIDKPTLVSSSAQITYSGISSIPNGIVSSSTQVINYGIFATTGSNTFIGNQVITGSANISGSLEVNNGITIENGFIVLTQVSQSLEFVDDASAASAGVPLGGLYRNGNFIAIRIS